MTPDPLEVDDRPCFDRADLREILHDLLNEPLDMRCAHIARKIMERVHGTWLEPKQEGGPPR